MDFVIATKKAIFIGMIINELLTNIYKYAFKNRHHGTILVSIEKINNKVTLSICDDGVDVGIDRERASPWL
jgi:two-component sensor histidine kinase